MPIGEWKTPASSTPSATDDTSKDVKPSKHPYLAMGARVAAPIVGGALGEMVMPVGGGALGAASASGLTEAFVEKYLENRALSPKEIGLESAISAIPMGKAGATFIRNVGRRALGGAALGAGADLARAEFVEGRTPGLGEVAKSAALGGAMGGVAGGLEGALRYGGSNPTNDPYRLSDELQPHEMTDPTIQAHAGEREFNTQPNQIDPQGRPIPGAKVVSREEAHAAATSAGEENLDENTVEQHRVTMQNAENHKQSNSQRLAASAHALKKTKGASGNPTDPYPLRTLEKKLRDQPDAPKEPRDIVGGAKQSAREIRSATQASFDKLRANTAKVYSWLMRDEKYGNAEQLLGDFQKIQENQAADANRFTHTMQKKFPKKLTREAIVNYAIAGGNDDLLRYMVSKSSGALKRGYERALQLTDAEREAAFHFRKYTDDMLDLGIENGLFRNGVEDYQRAIWQRTPQNVTDLLDHFYEGGLNPNPSFLKKKFYSSYFEGELAGGIPRDKDIGFLTASYDKSFHNAVAVRKLLDNSLMSTSSEGSPMAVVSGNGHVSPIDPNDPTQGSKIFVNPHATPSENSRLNSVQITDRDGGTHVEFFESPHDAWARRAELMRADPQAKAEVGIADAAGDGEDFRKTYDYRKYKGYNHYAFRDYKWVAKAPVGGEPVVMKGDVLFHPDMHNYLDAMLSKSKIRESALGSFALGTSGTLKNLLLAGFPSPFHQTHLGLHAGMHGVGWRDIIQPPEVPLENDDLQRLMSHFMTLFGSPSASREFMEGLSGSPITKHIPFIGEWSRKYEDYLFRSWLPRLKAHTALKVLDRNRVRFAGKLSEDQIFMRTAAEMNAAFGNQNWVHLGVTPQTRDVMRLMFLAPDFLVSKLQNMGQALHPQNLSGLTTKGFDVSRMKHPEQVASMILIGGLGQYMAARVFNKLVTGSYHWDRPFSFVAGDHEYSPRTLQGDAWHLWNDPNSFIQYRLNPITARPVVEFLMKRDPDGRPRENLEMARDFVSNVIPIPVQELRKSFTDPQINLFHKFFDGAANAVGLHSYRYRSDAEKQVYNWTYRIPLVGQDETDKERHAAAMRFEQAVREGRQPDSNDTKMISRRQMQVRTKRAGVTEFESRVMTLDLPKTLELLKISHKDGNQDEVEVEGRHLTGLMSRSGLANVPEDQQEAVRAQLADAIKWLAEIKSPVPKTSVHDMGAIGR